MTRDPDQIAVATDEIWPLLVIPAEAGIHLSVNLRITMDPGLRRDNGSHTVMVERHPCVYILANDERGTLYVGVTSDLIKRIWEHKNNVVAGFTRKYQIHDLVWFEQHETMESAIRREKAIKEWKRAWKLELIESANPHWDDLYSGLTNQPDEQNGFRPAPE
ncbi:MAG TPA: GIY-YIG nuclease family protein [Rhodanobacteraceae bacterium]|nr:GIY-YIG nuclease family protein [Rhodanobacteraceae bacterium]